MSKPPHYRLVLRALPDPCYADRMPPERVPGWVGVPPKQRYKDALKVLLRRFGLVCVWHEEVEQTAAEVSE